MIAGGIKRNSTFTFVGIFVWGNDEKQPKPLMICSFCFWTEPSKTGSLYRSTAHVFSRWSSYGSRHDVFHIPYWAFYWPIIFFFPVQSIRLSVRWVNFDTQPSVIAATLR